MKVEWTDSLSVKNEQLDAQHKKWIENINNYHHELMQNSFNSGLTRKMIVSMLKYAKMHFAFEEDYMEKIQYTEIIQHKSLHNTFLNRMKTYLKNFDNGDSVLPRQIMKEMTDWLVYHIQNEDKKMDLIL